MTRHDAAGPVLVHFPHPGREETAGTLSVPVITRGNTTAASWHSLAGT